MNKSVFQIIVSIILAFSAGFFVQSFDITSDKKLKSEKEIESIQSTFFTCPMHPHIYEQHEGDCPICGMSLVKKEIQAMNTGDKGNSQAEIYVSPSVVNNFAIKTSKVLRGNISKEIRIYGYVNKVKNSSSILLKSPVSGSVRYINKSHEENKYYKNEVIIALESNEILNIQKKYLESVKSNNLIVSRQLKQNLSKLGYTFDQLKALIKTRKPSNIFNIRLPDTGILLDSNIKLNQKIKAGQVIGKLQPLYSISVVSKVYESQWIWLKAGQQVVMKIRSLSGPVWNGEVRQVNDLGQSSTTAVKLFADFEKHKDSTLRLGMQTEMTVYGESKYNVLKVPSSAVIKTGLKTIVIIAKAGGHFKSIDVEIGLDNDEYIEIISGLKQGMKVVVAGQFLLDSESELRAEISRMQSLSQESEN